MTKQEFIIKTLEGYIIDPSTCGYDSETGYCRYLTKWGNKCAVGKWMKEGEWQKEQCCIGTVFSKYPMKKILMPTAVEQNLSIEEWSCIQYVHDEISTPSNKKTILSSLIFLEKISEVNLNKLKQYYE